MRTPIDIAAGGRAEGMPDQVDGGALPHLLGHGDGDVAGGLLIGAGAVPGIGAAMAGATLILFVIDAQSGLMPLDQVVAIVDDGVILQSELDARVNTIRSRLQAQGTGLPPRQVLEERVLDQLITENIQLDIRGGLTAPQCELRSRRFLPRRALHSIFTAPIG